MSEFMNNLFTDLKQKDMLIDNTNDKVASEEDKAIWKPTMCLRWYETDNYNPVNDDFDKVLQQKWQSDTGEEKWQDIEVYGREY